MNMTPRDFARDAVLCGVSSKFCPYPPHTARAAEFRRWRAHYEAHAAVQEGRIAAVSEELDAGERQVGLWSMVVGFVAWLFRKPSAGDK